MFRQCSSVLSGGGATLGAPDASPRDLVKPGISRVFPDKVVLRLKGLLRHLSRGRVLPGIVDTKAVKTRGQAAWRPVPPFRRLFDVGSAADYQSISLQATQVLLLGGASVGERTAAESAVALQQMARLARPLPASEACTRRDDCIRTVSAIKRDLTALRRGQRLRRGGVDEADDWEQPSIDGDDEPDSGPLPVLPDVSSSSNAPPPLLVGPGDDASAALTMRQGSLHGAEVPESSSDDESADSRCSDTEESYSSSEDVAATDEFGYSVALSETEWDWEAARVRSPSPACTGGGSGSALLSCRSVRGARRAAGTATDWGSLDY